MSSFFEVGLDKKEGYMWAILKNSNIIIDLKNPVLALLNELLCNPYFIAIKDEEQLVDLEDEGYIFVASEGSLNYFKCYKNFTQYNLLSGDQIRFIVCSSETDVLLTNDIFKSERRYVDDFESIKYIISSDFDAEGIEVYFKPESDVLNLILEKINHFPHSIRDVS